MKEILRKENSLFTSAVPPALLPNESAGSIARELW
jgi:hypothetical protein